MPRKVLTESLTICSRFESGESCSMEEKKKDSQEKKATAENKKLGMLSRFSPVEGKISQLADCQTGGWSHCVVSSASEMWQKMSKEIE